MRKAVAVLILVIVVILGCDSGGAVDLGGDSNEPKVEIAPSIAISAFNENDGSARIMVKQSGHSSFVAKNIPNQNVIVNLGVKWNASGTGLFFQIGQTDKAESQELAYLNIEEDSIMLVREDYDIDGRLFISPFSIRPSRSNPTLVAVAIERRFQGGSGYYVAAIDYDTGIRKDWDPNDPTRPAGWVGADTLVVLSLDSQEVLYLDSDLQLIETVQIPTEVFSDRLGAQWKFVNGDVSRDGSRIAVQVVGETNSQAAFEKQVAVVDLRNPALSTWVSDDLESADSFPSWGPNNSVVYISTILGDRTLRMGAHARIHYLESRKSEQLLHPYNIGVSSLFGIDLHW